MAKQFNGFLVVEDVNEYMDVTAGELLKQMKLGTVCFLVFRQEEPTQLYQCYPILTGRFALGTYTFETAGETTYTASSADDYPKYT